MDLHVNVWFATSQSRWLHDWNVCFYYWNVRWFKSNHPFTVFPWFRNETCFNPFLSGCWQKTSLVIGHVLYIRRKVCLLNIRRKFSMYKYWLCDGRLKSTLSVFFLKSWCYGLGLEFCPLDNFCVLSISCLLVLLSAFLIQVFTNSQKLMPIKGVYCPCHNENNLPDCHNVTQSFVLLLNNRSLSLLKLPPDYPFTFIITVMLFTHSYLYRCFKMGFYKKNI